MYRKAVKKPGINMTAVTATPKRKEMKAPAAAESFGGPGQPESNSFHSANTANMVDLFTGNFSYTLPLMDVGGYPVTIGYNSGITMDEEASWVGLGWNINAGAINRNMRGLPDDFNGTDSILKTSSVKDSKTIGVTSGMDVEVTGVPIGLGGSLGVFHNTYRGWGLEYGVNVSINVGAKAASPLTAGMSLTNNSQQGVTLSPSLSLHAQEKRAADKGSYGGFLAIGTGYNSRSGMQALQLSAGTSGQKGEEGKKPRTSGNSISRTLMSFAYPSFTPTVNLPYTSSMYAVTLKIGGAITLVHPSFFVSGYMSNQYIAPEDQHRSIPAYGYLNYQNGTSPDVLLDYNREKEIPYREKPDLPNIGLPTYTYDVFSVTGEGTGGMFRAYRSDLGFVYDHYMKTKDQSGKISIDIGWGNIVHGGVDLNYVRAFSETGRWTSQNPLANTIGFQQQDKLFEPAYFRNPGEATANDKSFYDAIGGDDLVAVDLYQLGNSSSTMSTTNYLNRYRNQQLVEKVQLKKETAVKTNREKRTQVITYLTAKEAGETGLSKYIESYTLNTFGMQNCDNTFPDETNASGTGLLGDYFKGIMWWTQGWHKVYSRLDSKIDFSRTEDIKAGSPEDLGDEYSVSWKGRLKADETGTYTLITDSDDGAALYLNGKQMTNRWYVQGAGDENTMGKTTVNLVAGQFVDIQLDYFQFRKLGSVKLYWEYNGHPRTIIPQAFLYPPVSKDTFRTGIGVTLDGGKDTLITKEKRVYGFRKADHISEIDVLNNDGRRYVYGLPVYNLKQQEATFAVNAGNGNIKDGLVKYTPGVDDSTTNRNGTDWYFNREEMPAYAHSFLLTGILSPDYMDFTGDGISDDDRGNAVKFNYTRVAGIHNPYGWRSPYTDSASYIEGLRADNRDDKGSYIYGEKELWYMHSIESKNMIATFKLGDRKDLLAIDRDGKKHTGPAKKLEEINLYNKADFRARGLQAVPVKTVHFSYSYTLCRGINGAVNDSGKLTLDSIWFTYNGNEKGKRNPYVFHYNKNNPGYNAKSFDRWGNYKDPLQNPGSSSTNLITNSEYPYSLQDSTLAANNAAAWTLDSIIEPAGGRMKITYESDDYGYVQNKRAAQLFKIAGFSNTKPVTGSPLSSNLYDAKTTFDIADNLYVCINVPRKVNNNNEVYSWYLQGLDTTYFKLFTKMPTDKWGSGSEYVPCYATLDLEGGYGSINGGSTIWVKLKSIDNDGNAGGPYSPLAKAAIQFLRLNLPSKAYPGSDIGDDAGIADQVKVVLGMAGNIINMFSSFDNTARNKGWAKTVDLSRTFIRLNNPFFKKYGGGLRVKSIVSYDHWSAMTKQKESVYGQEYLYTTTRLVNNVKETISSGVAVYEPVLGGEENPWRVPVKQYGEQVAALAPVNLGYTEEPLGESLFPAPAVGYSKVRVRSIHTKNTRSANGYTETNFYTAYDFPTLTEKTNLADQKRKYKPALGSFLHIDAKYFLAVSQGFKVELNDMHGKIRSVATYPETDPEHYITYTENFYHVDDVNAEFKHLNNTVPAITLQGAIDPAASIGKDVELMTDMREQRAVTHAYNVNLNTDMFAAGILPWLIPSLLNLAQRDENKFRSVAVTKVVNRHGIVDSVRAIDKGSRVTTSNMLYSSESGEPVLTGTQNEYNAPIYHFTYPADWMYDGMSGAYKNVGFVTGDIDIKQGKVTRGLTAADVAAYFASGDEILIWSSPKTSGDDCNPRPATYPLSGKLWAVDATAISGGDPDIYFVDAKGAPFTGYNISLKIIRSGRKNISAVAGEVTMMANPLKKDAGGAYHLVIDNNSKIINAAVTEFKQHWKVDDARKARLICAPNEQ
ncbi:PA14 domain-containing protein [Chitinophaga agrisoli]|nr:PA14 domain-containing protein [Chitinophaga agrisoli]